jgi:hydroxymethylpyrimidine/phosphomethylpyrimidine kinase
VALCLGGLDPSAGAGLLRDVMTLAALGVQPMAVCTADTIQNGSSCLGIRPPADPLPALEALAPHLTGPDWGVKLGLCALDDRTFSALAARVAELAPPVRIWDPILAPTSGVGLHSGRRLRSMAETLLAGGDWVVCPNLPEAAALAGTGLDAGCAALARPFLDLGAVAVWLKGGHGQGPEVEDFWITPGAVLSLGRSPRLPGDRRGTGCTLASAWLAWRLRGLPGPDAAAAAARFLRERWDPPVQPGGYGRPCFAPGAP